MQLNYLLTCDAATIDSSHKMNLVGVFDRVFTESFPTALARMDVAFEIIEVKDADLDVSLKINHKQTGLFIAELSSKQTIDLAQGDRLRMVASVVNMPFPEEGEYVIELKVNDEIFVSPSTLRVQKQSSSQ